VYTQTQWTTQARHKELNMSRAFISEEAAEATASLAPERPISDAPNFVTPRGLQLIDREVARLQELLLATPSDGPDRPRIARDLRYWRARQASTKLVEAAIGRPDEVAFGTRVTIVRDSSTISYQLVGEDEADPAQGLLSWTSPLATALLGGRVGDVVEIGGGRQAVTIRQIERS
jgi:transcription elongation GreA/GreB family factor